LRGVYPITAEAEELAAPRLILQSRDLDWSLEPDRAGEILAYANPADPFALHKAALVLCDIVPGNVDPGMPIADLMAGRGGGLRLSTHTSIPRGSGLGTSSIIAGAVLACLRRLCEAGEIREEVRRSDSRQTTGQAGLPEEYDELFDEVLCLEQMITTGGGWQDQVGGLTGGIKLIATEPGLPQRVRVAPVGLTAETEAALAERLLLVYTGQQRLAKNLLRSVMGRWMARDPEMVRILKEIARLARAMKDALESGDLDGFGELLAEHWRLNKRMDPGCSNTFIDELFEAIGPCVGGAKLAGAGGGGFVIAMARSREAVEQIHLALERRFHGTSVAVWPSRIPTRGIVAQ
jgi:fucokinase / fucose-1-phosphate guanylyltransferase